MQEEANNKRLSRPQAVSFHTQTEGVIQFQANTDPVQPVLRQVPVTAIEKTCSLIGNSLSSLPNGELVEEDERVPFVQLWQMSQPLYSQSNESSDHAANNKVHLIRKTHKPAVRTNIVSRKRSKIQIPQDEQIKHWKQLMKDEFKSLDLSDWMNDSTFQNFTFSRFSRSTVLIPNVILSRPSNGLMSSLHLLNSSQISKNERELDDILERLG